MRDRERTQAPGSAAQEPRSASQATPERIIDCAREVLFTQGYARFRVRAVAAAAGISPGNLAYHFPSKQQLLRGVVERMVADYSSQFEALLSEREVQPGQDFLNLVRWLLTDAVKEETVRIYRELWAISLHDEETRLAIDDMYDELMAGVVALLKRSYRDVDQQRLEEVVQLVAFASEGSIVLYGTRPERTVSHERMIEVVLQIINLYVPELLRIDRK